MNQNELLSKLQALLPNTNISALVQNIAVVEGNNNIIIQGVNGSTFEITQNIEITEVVLSNILKKLQKPIHKQLNNIPTITPPKIIGRDKDVQEVRRLLIEKNTLVIVNGLGGIGKTTLSHYYWQQYNEKYEHLLWVSGENEIENSLLF